MKIQILACLLALLCAGCSKSADDLAEQNPSKPAVQAAVDQAVVYTIKKGSHSSNHTGLKQVNLSSLDFSVRFDSSAIYRTEQPINQYDINKLLGFADNGAHHHQFSARFGWRWSDQALRLFAYVYNSGKRMEKEITTIPIGQYVDCSIRVQEGSYLFRVNEVTVTMPRSSTTANGVGYMLYPYFGGDEVAPHDVTISIRYR